MMVSALVQGLRAVTLSATLCAGLWWGAAPALAQPLDAPAPTPVAEAHAPADHAAPAADDTHAPAPAAADHGTVDHAAAPGGDHGAAASHGGEHGEEHGESIWVTLARIVNFAILAWVLYYFGREPLANHLASRRTEIRRSLVEAAEMRQTATARLAEIEARLAALPKELEEMRQRGAEELEAERTRMRAAAEAERDRLVEQARREIELQTRHAQATLRAEAAALAVDVAEAQLRSTLTPAEQNTLVDRYATQMRNVQ